MLVNLWIVKNIPRRTYRERVLVCDSRFTSYNLERPFQKLQYPFKVQNPPSYAWQLTDWGTGR